MGKLLKTLLAIVIAVIVIAAAVIGWGHYYRVTYKFDAPKEITRVDGGETIIAEGKALYDENGKMVYVETKALQTKGESLTFELKETLKTGDTVKLFALSADGHKPLQTAYKMTIN